MAEFSVANVGEQHHVDRQNVLIIIITIIIITIIIIIIIFVVVIPRVPSWLTKRHLFGAGLKTQKQSSRYTNALIRLHESS